MKRHADTGSTSKHMARFSKTKDSSDFYKTFSKRSHKDNRREDSRRHRNKFNSENDEHESNNVHVKQEPLSSDEENLQPRHANNDGRHENRKRRAEENAIRPNIKTEQTTDTENESNQHRKRNRRNEKDQQFGWGKTDIKKEQKPALDKQKPDFKLSGKLAEDTNMFNGVVVKYSEPPEACKPKRRWRFYVFKGKECLPTLFIHRQSAYLVGRDRKVADLPVDHPSCSKQHAAIQYRCVPYEKPSGRKSRKIVPYVIDLESANGTYVNNQRIDAKRYVELLEKDVVKFGFSSREYVLLHEGSKGDDNSGEV